MVRASDWKIIKVIGSGVREIRIRCADGAYRVIYTVKLADAVYVLHAFQKKTQKMPQQAIDMAKKRLSELGG
ncbi:MAG: addiction module toxin RelE [Proteobacteria bacterium]|nr:MAG: addiction module toxin RelE [Pseudomonadota bacterium]